MLVLSVLSNFPKGQVELKVGQGKQKTHFPTGQVDLNLFFLPWTQTKMLLHLFGICLAYFICLFGICLFAYAVLSHFFI